MEKKYQVFVSSTYEDLRAERQEVMHALLELDCIPSGMELFPAADEDQWSLIQQVIDECDYYVLILGGRYGSIGTDGIGYTEKEYLFALEAGKPIAAFLHDDPESLPQKHTETTEKGQASFKRFRELAEKKMCKYWKTKGELGAVVSRGLINLKKKHPAIGWVRGDLVPTQGASLEILELRKQIDTLNATLDEVRTKAPTGTEDLAQGDDVLILEYTWQSKPRSKSQIFDPSHTFTAELTLSWSKLFYQISPKLIHEATDQDIKQSLNQLIARRELPDITSEYGESWCNIGGFQLSDEKFQTIKVQFRALGLITKSEKTRSVKDKETYWTLTPFGDSMMNRLRAIRKHPFEDSDFDAENQ